MDKNYKISIKPSKKKGLKLVKVTLEGNLVIDTIEEIKDKFKEIVKKYKELNLSIKNVEDIDLTAIQLIQVLKSEFCKDKCKFNLDIELSEEHQKLFEITGIENKIKTI